MLALTVLLLVNLALAGRLQYTLDQLAFQTKCELVDPTEARGRHSQFSQHVTTWARHQHS